MNAPADVETRLVPAHLRPFAFAMGLHLPHELPLRSMTPGEEDDDHAASAGDSGSDGASAETGPAAGADPASAAGAGAGAGTSTDTAAADDDEPETEDRIEPEEPIYQPGMNWFVLRVASNKENYVRDTLRRKVQIEGLTDLVGRILVPTEKTKTMKGGKQRIQETKLYPGYVFVEMRLEEDGRIPQDVFFLIKETTGVGDFVGTTGKPAPLSVHEVEKMLHDSKKPEETPQIKADFVKGDVVKIKEGPFENYEGTVDEFLPEKGIVRVLVTIFGRQAPIEVEYWMLQRADEQ
ncbi:MAG: transcription termination/antitermination protein NusG [Planctomycetota bacterium]